MSELILTRGLPASGKTTWARAWVADDPTNRSRVNRDDLRHNLFGAPMLDWDGERAVTTAQHAAVRALLKAGRSVVVDDTNLRAKHARALLNLAVRAGADWSVKDFTHVPLQTCIDRDQARAAAGDRAVGAAVIQSLHARYLAAGALPDLAPTLNAAPALVRPYVPDPTLPAAWLVDLDGTLALGRFGEPGRRGPFDWHRVGEDRPNLPVIELCRALAASRSQIVVLSGRDAICRDQSTGWLALFDVPHHALVMRPIGDSRPDHVVKAELFWAIIAETWNVRGVIDDRASVVAMWRAMGLVCAQVAPGDF